MEVVAPTEEAVATDEAAPVVVVNVTNDESTAAPTTDSDWLNIRQIVELGGSLLVIIAFIFKGGDLMTGLGNLVNRATGSAWLTSNAMKQYQTLSPDLKSKIATVIDLADPLSKTTASDVDDRVVTWVRKITAPVEPSSN